MGLQQNLTAMALIEALFPQGKRLDKAEASSIANSVDQHFDSIPGLSHGLTGLLTWLNTRFLLLYGKSFAAAPLELRQAFLAQKADSIVTGKLLRALETPFRAAYLLDEQNLKRVGTHNGLQVPSEVEQHHWQSQVSKADDLEPSQTLDADVVIIGTGAGGGAAAYELASRGLAVVILEEGLYYGRKDFNGKLTEVIPKLYRGWGGTVTLGNVAIPVPVGRSVGGTTTINSGTCMRTPDSVLKAWASEGLEEFTSEIMTPYFETVEAMISVERAEIKFVGEIAEVVKKGADAVGLTHSHALMRNAKGCDGQGLCQFGCPTDAKQSTNVSYIPRALDAGAFLFTGMKAEELHYRGGDACNGKNARVISGVTATGVGENGIRRHLRVNADTVIVSAGTFFTPQLLAKNGIKNKWLGRNLSIHPAGAVLGHYANRNFKNTATIPQGYGVADWAEMGVMFEGGTPPFIAHGLMSPFVGNAFVEFAENYQQTAYFGFMIKDTSRGNVRRGVHPDFPLLTYHLNKTDFALFKKAAHMLALMHLEAGADKVTLASMSGLPSVSNRAELDALFARKLKPRDFAVTAYHPLGTARIAKDEKNGVCDKNHQVFGVDGLYVMDGSAVPSSLGANPQVTIMAMATKAASRIAEQKLNYV
ncbi:GMC oxidoreductase [Gammaproteobacteria bacterium 42_54_T18]|nr:GMC oxidoreductase [Gammaproteobacteria bacterium 42_54_T18]